MAWDYDAYRIHSDSVANGLCGHPCCMAFSCDGHGDVAVGARVAKCDGTHFLMDFSLEWRDVWNHIAGCEIGLATGEVYIEPMASFAEYGNVLLLAVRNILGESS